MIHTKKLAILVGLLFLVTPLAGCVGGGDAGPSSTADDADDAANTTGNLTGVSQADLRPHVHDRWVDPVTGQSLEQVELVNRDIQIDAQNSSRSVPVNFCQQGEGSAQEASVCIGQKELFPGFWGNGEQKIVPPGTSHLEITLDFNANDFSEVAFYFQDRTTQQYEMLTNESNGGNFAPGGDTKELPVSVKQSDDGHAHVSSWKFLVEARGVPGAGNPNAANVEYGEGTISVTITAHRVDGELPLEPPHPLFWGNDEPPTTVYQIGQLRAEDAFTQVARLTLEPEDQAWSFQGEGAKGKGVIWQIPTGFEGRRLNAQGNYPNKLGGDFTTSIVPPKSRLLVADVKVDGEVQAGNNPPIVCVFGQDIPGKGFRGVKQLGDGCQTFEPGMEFTAKRQITNRDTDSFYTNTSTSLSRSRWTFYVQIKASNDGQGVTQWSGSVQADFFVTDQTQFEMPEWALAGSSGGSGGGNATTV